MDRVKVNAIVSSGVNVELSTWYKIRSYSRRQFVNNASLKRCSKERRLAKITVLNSWTADNCWSPLMIKFHLKDENSITRQSYKDAPNSSPKLALTVSFSEIQG
jgi:hypothetical protein